MGLISSPRAPTPGWPALLAAVCLAQATAIAGFDFTLPFVPLYLQHDLGVHGLGQTAIWAGLIGFGPAIPATISGPLWGRLADRFGYRAMLLRAMVSAAILLSLMGLAPSPGVLLVLRMIQGSLTGTIFAAQALVAAAVPEKETARSIGLLQMSVFGGATLGPIGGGAVAQLLGYRAAFFSAGILLASATVVVFIFVREPARRVVSGADGRTVRPSTFSLLAIPAFAAAVVLMLLVQLAGTSLFPILPLFVQELLHTSRGVATHTGWLMALTGISAACGSYVAARLQRRVGLKRMLMVEAVVSAGLIAPQAFVGSYLELLMFRSMGAFAFGGLVSLVGTLAAVSSPAHAKGAAFGLIGAASSLGFGCGPLLGGALVAAVGIRPLFILSATLLGLIPLVLWGVTVVLPAALRSRQATPVPPVSLRAERE